MYKLFTCTCDHWCPPPHLIKKKMMNQLLPPVKGYTAPTDTILSDTHDQYLFSVLPLSVMSFYTFLQMYNDIPLITIPCMNDLVNQNFVLLTTVQLCLICGSKFLSTYSLNRRLYLKNFAILFFQFLKIKDKKNMVKSLLCDSFFAFGMIPQNLAKINFLQKNYVIKVWMQTHTIPQ